MSDQTTNGASAAPAKKPRQGRSPAFPFINLKKALERTDAVRVAEGGRPKHFAPVASACKAWGMGVKTGPAIQTIAALNHFGLVEFEGSGEMRAMRPTEHALRILLDKQPESPERDALIKRMALNPPIHKELWDKWGPHLPSDPTLETYLVRDRSFSEGGARDLMAEYKATIAFAKLKETDQLAPGDAIVSNGNNKDTPANVEVGDLVNAEVEGALVFPEPKRVRAIHDGWIFVDDIEAGVEAENVEIVEKGQVIIPPVEQKVAPRLPLPKKDIEPTTAGTRVLRFALNEGDVVITYPENLSVDSVEDLDGFWQVFLKRARREAKTGNMGGSNAN